MNNLKFLRRLNDTDYVVVNDNESTTIKLMNIFNDKIIKIKNLNEIILNVNLSDDYIIVSIKDFVVILNMDFDILRRFKCQQSVKISLNGRLLSYLSTVNNLITSGIIASNKNFYTDKASSSLKELTYNLRESYKHFNISKSVPISDHSNSNDINNDDNDLFKVINVLDLHTNKIVNQFELSSYSPLSYMSISHSGRLIFVADSNAHIFHIYELRPKPLISFNSDNDDNDTFEPVWHRYSLHRGYTSAVVTSMTWSLDERFVGVCTDKGTIHIYAINPVGGKVTKAHMESIPINLGFFQPLSVEISPIARIKIKFNEYPNINPRRLSIRFEYPQQKSQLNLFVYDEDYHQLKKFNLVLNFIDHDSNNDDHFGGIFSGDKKLIVERISEIDIKEVESTSHNCNNINTRYKCKDNVFEIETNNFGNTIYKANQFEFKRTDEINIDEVDETISKASYYKVRPESKVFMSENEDEGGDLQSTMDDNIDKSHIHSLIPALPNGYTTKTSFSLPDQSAIKNMIKNGYRKFSMSFNYDNDIDDEDAFDDNNFNFNNTLDDDLTYREAINASEEADKFVVGLVDDDDH